jgi:transcriptional regulator with XRE-family HTH domain
MYLQMQKYVIHSFQEVIPMKDRIRRIRKDLNLTQDAFGAAVGATRAMIGFYESGKVVPDKPIRLLICEKYNVNETWLETGEGVPYKEGLIPELANALRNMPTVAAALERLLPRMSVEDFEHIDAMVRKIVEDK